MLEILFDFYLANLVDSILGIIPDYVLRFSSESVLGIFLDFVLESLFGLYPMSSSELISFL